MTTSRLLAAAAAGGALALAGALAQVSGRTAVTRPLRSTALAGGLTGVATTTTAVTGPPVVLHLLEHAVPPPVARATLSAIFLVLALATMPLLAAAGASFPSAGLVGVALVACGAGWGLGVAIRGRVPAAKVRALTITLVLVSGATGVAGALV